MNTTAHGHGPWWLLLIAAFALIMMIRAIRRSRREGRSLLPPLRFYVVTAAIAGSVAYLDRDYGPWEHAPDKPFMYTGLIAVSALISGLLTSVTVTRRGRGGFSAGGS
jgi:CDP-diglyceride synthetase